MSRCCAQIFGLRGEVTLVLRVATPQPADSTPGWQLAVYNSTQPGTSGSRLGVCAISNALTGGLSSFEDVECIRIHAGAVSGVLHLAFVIEEYPSGSGRPEGKAPVELLRIDHFELVHV